MRARPAFLALSLSLALPLLLAADAPAPEQKRIEAKIVSVSKDDSGCFQDLGFVIAGDAKALDAEARKLYPKGNNFFNKDNVGKKNKFLGTYVVVVKSKKAIPRVAPCEGVGYGLGFGTDEASAKKDAVRNLGTRWFQFDDAKHGLEVVLSEQR